MKVLAYSPIPSDGTSFYRAFGPLNHLSRNFQSIEIINGSQENTEYNWNTLGDIDVVFAQRPSTSLCVQLIKTAKKCRKKVWIDYDDDYINIPKSNPRQDLYNKPERQALIRESMMLADVITVSTEPIKNSILEHVNTSAEIIVVKNAFDEDLFLRPNKKESDEIFAKRNKTVLWRGGDTHVVDVELYKEAIINCFNNYPDYKWCFYGHHFDWITEIVVKNGWHDRVLYYEFQDVMQYFINLMQLRPDIMIVPLEDNVFNRAKSNISWIEGTLAGATVMASKLPEFEQQGCLNFTTNEEFEYIFHHLVNDRILSKNIYLEAVENIPSLYDVNVKRSEIITTLLDKKFKPATLEAEQWGDKRFFEYALMNGFIQENEHYAKGHHSVADWLIEKLDPDTVIEFGCGPGAMLEWFLKNNVQSLGIELNEYFIDYWRTRNPVFADRVVQFDITKLSSNSDLIEETDLGVSIEVFEHIDMPEEEWNKLIQILSKKFKNFYFSSTPYRASVKFDKQWGHTNIRPMKSWVDLFTRNGWEYVGNPQKICPWDLLFKSNSFDKKD